MGCRILFLVRHGQYITDEKKSRHGQLSALGRRQAKRTGLRLLHLPDEVKLQAIYHSDMPRAVETAEIIASQLGEMPMHRMRALRETVPPLPKRRGFKPRTRKELASVRAVTAKLKKMFLTAPSGKRRRAELVVAHGNLIRYLVRLAMRDNAIDWWRLGTNNCGVTLIWVNSDKPNCLAHYNDVGHLPASMQTRM
jgi:serine/threonine-protein phosphatase PGAM5